MPELKLSATELVSQLNGFVDMFQRSYPINTCAIEYHLGIREAAPVNGEPVFAQDGTAEVIIRLNKGNRKCQESLIVQNP
jgi:hypothetical protein